MSSGKPVGRIRKSRSPQPSAAHRRVLAPDCRSFLERAGWPRRLSKQGLVKTDPLLRALLTALLHVHSSREKIERTIQTCRQIQRRTPIAKPWSRPPNARDKCAHSFFWQKRKRYEAGGPSRKPRAERAADAISERGHLQLPAFREITPDALVSADVTIPWVLCQITVDPAKST